MWMFKPPLEAWSLGFSTTTANDYEHYNDQEDDATDDAAYYDSLLLSWVTYAISHVFFGFFFFPLKQYLSKIIK